MLETVQLQNTTKHAPEIVETEDLTSLQRAAIRDEYLRPLILQLRHQSEEVGRLQVQVEHLRAERDRLLADAAGQHEDAAPLSEPGLEADDDIPEVQSTSDRLVHLLTQLPTAEGAAVAGIAIALGLWIGVGLMTFAILG